MTAQRRTDFDRAKRFMFLAKSKLKEDNRLMSDGNVSSIRFDLEDWSRRIVEMLDLQFVHGHGLTPALLSQYLTFVRQVSDSGFADLRGAERNSLFHRICDKMKFNCLVIVISLEQFGLAVPVESDAARQRIVVTWNELFGSVVPELKFFLDSSNLKAASTIEKAYMLALAANSPTAKFVARDLNVRDEVEDFFGSANRETLKAVSTSLVDAERFRRLERFCRECTTKMREGDE